MPAFPSDAAAIRPDPNAQRLVLVGSNPSHNPSHFANAGSPRTTARWGGAAKAALLAGHPVYIAGMGLIIAPPRPRWTAYPNAGLHGITAALGAEGEYIERTFPSLVPAEWSGARVVVASDYSGGQSGSDFETYSFLLTDEGALPAFHTRMVEIGSTILKGRTVSFEDRKDVVQQRAQPSFFEAADQLPGVLATVVVDRGRGKARAFGLPPELVAERGREVARGPFAGLPPFVFERMMRVMMCGTTLIAGLASASQDVIWYTDNDDIVANDRVANIFRLAVATRRGQLQPGAERRVKIGTPQSRISASRKTEWENLASIADFAAGTLAAAYTGSQRAGLNIGSPLVQLLPSDLPDDIRDLMTWMADDRWPLKRWVLLMKPLPDGSGWSFGAEHLYRFASLRPHAPV